LSTTTTFAEAFDEIYKLTRELYRYPKRLSPLSLKKEKPAPRNLHERSKNIITCKGSQMSKLSIIKVKSYKNK